MTLFGKWAILLSSFLAIAVATVGISARVPEPPRSMQQAPQSGYAGTETCVGCHENYDTTINATKHGFTANANAHGQAGLRVVPRPGRGARQRPREREADPVRQGRRERRQRAVPDLPQPRRARAVGRQPAREPERQVRRLPQRALERGADADAREDPADSPVPGATRPSPTSSSASTTCRCARAR